MLIVVAFVGLGGDTPTSEDSGATINAFYDSHSAREFIASFVLAAAAPFFVIFAVSLALALWPVGGGGRALWQYVLIAGGATAGLAFVITGMLLFALTDAADQSNFSESALQALNVLSSDSWVAFNAGLGVMMLGAAGSLFARKASPAAGVDRTRRGHRELHPVRRLRRPHRGGPVDHLDEHSAVPARQRVRSGGRLSRRGRPRGNASGPAASRRNAPKSDGFRGRLKVPRNGRSAM